MVGEELHKACFFFFHLKHATAALRVRWNESSWQEKSLPGPFPKEFLGGGFENKADEQKSSVSARSLMQQHLRGLNQADIHDKRELSLKTHILID